MIYELRLYTIKTGCFETFVDLMNSKILPFQEKMGMRICGTFSSLSDEDVYIWIRAYKDEKEKQDLYDKVYGSSYWKEEIRPEIGDMIVREKTEALLMKSNKLKKID